MKKIRRPGHYLEVMTMRLPPVSFASMLGALVCTGCIGTLDLHGATDETSSTGDDPTSATSVTQSSTVGTDSATTMLPPAESSGSDSSEGSSTGESSTGDDDEPWMSVCDPQPDYDTEMSVRLEVPDGFSDELGIDATCIVDAVQTDGGLDPGEHRVVLRCNEAEVEVERALIVRTEGVASLPFDVGASVRLRVDVSISIDTGGWQEIAVHDAEGTLLLGRHDGGLAPDEIDSASWFAPFTFTLDTSVCGIDELLPPEEEGGGFILVPCPTDSERAAWTIDSPWGGAQVYDARRESIGAYLVRAPYAKTSTLASFAEPNCNPTPVINAQLVFLRGE